MDIKDYVGEIIRSGKTPEVLATLNAYKSELLKESKDSKLVEAAKALEAAKVAYKRESTRVVLADKGYNDLQTLAVRTTVSEFAHTHNLPSFFAWFDANGKDNQVGIIDTPQKLGSHLKSLHDSFAAGNKVAKKKKATLSELQAQMLALQAQMAALQNGGE